MSDSCHNSQDTDINLLYLYQSKWHLLKPVHFSNGSQDYYLRLYKVF